MSQIGAICRRLKRKDEIRLVIIDYLQLIEPEDKRAPREQQIAGITRRLKFLSKELSVPVVALAQLNRGVEGRDNKRPTLADLRQSGSIEQDADLVLMLYREAYYLTTPCSDPRHEGDRIARLMEVQNRIEVIIAKNRNGPTCTVPLFCNIAANAFRNWSRAV